MTRQDWRRTAPIAGIALAVGLGIPATAATLSGTAGEDRIVGTVAGDTSAAPGTTC